MESLKRKVILEDGSVYRGKAFGSLQNRKAEIVFNTSMVGYQEILSDPSYTDQVVVMCYPLIGNYGMCEDDYETDHPSMTGFIVREYCEVPSNFRCNESLEEVMKKYDIVGIQGVDTRKLTRHIRNFGSCKAYIVDDDYDTEQALTELRDWIPARDQVSRVSTKSVYEFDAEGRYLPENVTEQPIHVAVLDCGIKKNILREMRRKNMKLTVFPWNTSLEEILVVKPEGIFISNGPGDPTDVKETIATIKSLLGKLPIFGICLGHQIISLAYGAQTYKLKFGHRGGNHPVKNLQTDKLEITSQNHSYAVDDQTISQTKLQVTHKNLLDETVEGLSCQEDYVFSVQYHPESAPGPQDSSYLFDDFIQMIHRFQSQKKEG